MTMAGKPQICSQGGQIVILREQVQGSCEPQPQMIAIEGYPLGLLEHLRQVDRRAAGLPCDLRQAPAPGQIARQQYLDPIGQPAAWAGCYRPTRRARSQAKAHQRERQALSLQGLDSANAEAMAKHRDQGLCARIDAKLLEAEPDRFPSVQERRGREFPQDVFRQGKRQAGIAACDRMTDLVSLAGVEEQDMIGIGDRLIATDVAQVNPAIREHKVRHRDAFLFAAMTTFAAAPNVAQRYALRAEQPRNLELGWSRHAR